MADAKPTRAELKSHDDPKGELGGLARAKGDGVHTKAVRRACVDDSMLGGSVWRVETNAEGKDQRSGARGTHKSPPADWRRQSRSEQQARAER